MNSILPDFRDVPHKGHLEIILHTTRHSAAVAIRYQGDLKHLTAWPRDSADEDAAEISAAFDALVAIGHMRRDVTIAVYSANETLRDRAGDPALRDELDKVVSFFPAVRFHHAALDAVRMH